MKSYMYINISPGLFGAVVPFNLPDVGEAIMTVEVKEWYVLTLKIHVQLQTFEHNSSQYTSTSAA